MIKSLLGSAFLIVAVVGGAVAGDFVKNRPAGENASHEAKDSKKGAHGKKDSDSKTDSHGKKDKKHKKDKKKDKKKGKGDKKGHGGGGALDGPSYLKFKRQFVVPVVKGRQIEALVILNLNYELDEEAPDNIYSFEPKLRDAIVRELLTLSDEGIFSNDLTTPQNYELVRSTLLKAGQDVVPEGIRDVLILDIARQDQ